ncbi:hypothetical protein [Bacillus suaedae]|uniref:DUF2269 family protein n=1 Tax=Halalkalibacter suaedae TaxID=2822140 RepID=A0A940X0I1_9BACI|nr:hypothetical protein [Bacillus suaedae]MBP3952830.1 hypothetical protein [Bacillus suaedae]
MTYIISYGVHLLFSVFFFLLIPLPYLIKGSLDEIERFQLLLKIYKPIIAGAHIGVIVSLATGIFLAESWLSIWFAAVTIIWLAISAFLGITAKQMRILSEQIEAGTKMTQETITACKQSSLLLMVTIIIMFALKVLRYF